MSVASHFIRALTSPLKYHIYVSRSQNVAVNLSIEHYLFQKSHAESTILFLYVNKPCIVIGRNQNPWLEVNHALVRQSTVPIGPSDHLEEGKSPEKAKVEIIRRRSGGGTVFHDLGNVNFSVICPPATFNRDQHAEMVVQAIRETNPRARVNQRHDIVLDPGPLLDKGDCPDPDDTHRSRFTFGDGPLVPRKVSGSAYKLVRQRALHHGTCLFNSPNVSSISEYLRSPARLFLKARGVESVRSPIANISGQTSQSPSLTTHVLQRQIIEAFIQKYNLDVIDTHHFLGLNTLVARLEEKDGYASGVVDDHLLEVPEIAAGKREIESAENLYGQTPQFILSTHLCEEDDRPRPSLPAWFPPSARVYLKIKSGVIITSKISTSDHTDMAASERSAFDDVLRGRKILDVENFWDLLGNSSFSGLKDDIRRVSAWLDLMLGKVSGGLPS